MNILIIYLRTTNLDRHVRTHTLCYNIAISSLQSKKTYVNIRGRNVQGPTSYLYGCRAAKTKAAKLAPRFDSPEDMSDDEEILFDDIYEVWIKKTCHKLYIYIGKSVYK